MTINFLKVNFLYQERWDNINKRGGIRDKAEGGRQKAKGKRLKGYLSMVKKPFSKSLKGHKIPAGNGELFRIDQGWLISNM